MSAARQHDGESEDRQRKLMAYSKVRDLWRLREAGQPLACNYVLTLPLGTAPAGMILAQQRKSEAVDGAAGAVRLPFIVQTDDQAAGSHAHLLMFANEGAGMRASVRWYRGLRR